MNVVGKSPDQRCRVSVRVKAHPSAESEPKRPASMTPQTAFYIAGMCGELATMARSVNLTFLSHLLAMAQAEAENAGDYILFNEASD